MLRFRSVVMAPMDVHGRLAISLTRQYQNPLVGPNTLVTAAHNAMVSLLHQYANQPTKAEKLLVLTIRNAMITAIENS